MVLACAVFLALGAIPALQAGDYRAFSDAMAEASSNMRSAAFYLRTKNTMMGGFELDALDANWNPFVKRYADSPPEVYADDPKWRATLDDVSGGLTKARAAIAKGDIAAARRAVDAMRKALAALRRRNGVTVFEDCVEEMRETFAPLYLYRRKPPDFKSLKQTERVKATAAVAEYLFRRCYDRAPAAYHSDDMFERLFMESFADFEALSPAMAQGNTRVFVDLLRQIVSSLNLIFVRFG